MNHDLEVLIEERKELLKLYSKGKGDKQAMDTEIDELTYQINKLRREIKELEEHQEKYPDSNLDLVITGKKQQLKELNHD